MLHVHHNVNHFNICNCYSNPTTVEETDPDVEEVDEEEEGN